MDAKNLKFYPIFISLEGLYPKKFFGALCNLLGYPVMDIHHYSVSKSYVYFRINTVYNGRLLHQLLEMVLGYRLNMSYFDEHKFKEYNIQSNFRPEDLMNAEALENEDTNIETDL